MIETPFDPNVFLTMPREIQISKAAAMQLDRDAIVEDCLPHTLVIAIWTSRITVLRMEYTDLMAQWSKLDGGALSLVFEDGMATIDIITAEHERLSLICTDAECDEHQLDIEDLFNQTGARITRL